MSLHKLRVVPSIEEGASDGDYDYFCDCKAFATAQTCSHELAAHHIDGVLDLEVLRTELDKKKKRGRMELTAPALIRQDVFDEARSKKRSKG
jgi:hypothetical protein